MTALQPTITKDQFTITDIKCHPLKPYRLLISYASRNSQSSAFIVYSLNKMKESQRYEFHPLNYQDLGRALAVTFSPDGSKIAAVFSSGKVEVFKSKSGLQKNPLPLKQVELDNTYPLESAQMQWKKLGENVKDCCYVFYKYQVNQITEYEIGLFIGCEKKDLLSESFFIN